MGFRIGCWISFAWTCMASMLGVASFATTAVWSNGMRSYVAQAGIKNRSSQSQGHERVFAIDIAMI
jgi:hypothetical protein